MPKFRYVGRHPGDLHDGRVLEDGEVYDLPADAVKDEHNQVLVENGYLVQIESVPPKGKEAAK